ncbi:putative ABC-type exoprotein transport system permease subunit [Chryseobacterium jejuense]|nr:putative ABC-type exoprotein transport system permease subunit [Chryseobacterium jejuense]
MENNRVPQFTMNNIVISLYFTIAYAVLIIVYLGLPINIHSNFLPILFIVCSLLFSIAGIYFAGKSYKRAKISSVILIIINTAGLLIPLIMLLMIFT